MTDEVVLDDPLPDGRRLVVYADGREVVVGRAGPRPHPVPGWSWLGSHAAPARRRVLLPPLRRGTSPDADERAVSLLRSLLDEAQCLDYDCTGGFWVPTARGPVRLGQLYALLHRPVDEPSVERVLCVVPDRHLELPLADVWTNLLLTLAVEPDAFFGVAVVRHERARRP